MTSFHSSAPPSACPGREELGLFLDLIKIFPGAYSLLILNALLHSLSFSLSLYSRLCLPFSTYVLSTIFVHITLLTSSISSLSLL